MTKTDITKEYLEFVEQFPEEKVNNYNSIFNVWETQYPLRKDEYIIRANDHYYLIRYDQL